MTQTQVHASHREELGRFLKACRARIGPEEVGLAPGLRRRTSGLRREEVALLAGVGVTWYTWLEQGRPINASAQVLDAVARTLRLDPTEREHLYRLAELTPSRLPSTVEVLPDAVLEVLRALDPLPATVVNGRYDVIESNAAQEEMFWEWHSLPCLHKNLLWCCVTEPNARAFLLNYDEEVRHMVARMRADYARHLGDPAWEEDIRRLSALSPEFAELWARHEVTEPQARLRRFDHPRAGRLDFRLTELAVSEAPGLRIQVSTPDDAQTWARLPATRRAGS
ncbi:helix-turn-helix transcriptional regulator [Amycolatopsis sp., V23-08]|uniref:Helix-turn-helix transcriptional regulator n=1 Tax=Amycolatopsis heterodermiae TaxID=3110235 RepID=A0ABU5R1E3_9PSEU|nr:helix-turn-helix transcriptional regulator [Amycolatopsis sp., V23-08]MEA5359675.1 helix-turn-helix transcriptional regulator [Amycolatopsis sp., V23-08]